MIRLLVLGLLLMFSGAVRAEETPQEELRRIELDAQELMTKLNEPAKFAYRHVWREKLLEKLRRMQELKNQLKKNAPAPAAATK